MFIRFDGGNDLLDASRIECMWKHEYSDGTFKLEVRMRSKATLQSRFTDREKMEEEFDRIEAILNSLVKEVTC